MRRGRHRRRPRVGAVRLRLALGLFLGGAALAGAWAVAGGPTPAASPVARASPTLAASPTPTASPTTAGTEVAEPPAPPPRRFTIAATGDLLAHRSVWERAAEHGEASGLAFDFRPMFAKVRGILSAADLAICHLETPLSAHDTDLSSFPVFSVPHELAEAIAYAGYDECSTASNHALDRGTEGVAATLRALDGAGVRHNGTARNRAEGTRPSMLDVNGVRVAHLSYAYGFNGFLPPAEAPWAASRIDPERIVADADEARRRGAEFVVVSLHWGTEFVAAPTAFQQEVAAELLASPAVGVILGHHAHVVQPIARVGRKYVVYGLGNFLSNMTTSIGPPGVADGVIIHLRVEERGRRFLVTRIRYTPTWVEQGTTWRILPVGRMLDAKATPEATRSLLAASWERTVSAINALGADGFGVAPKRVPAALAGA